MAKGVKMLMVVLESMAGTKHKIIRIRPKADEKLELVCKDPFVQKNVLYRELKKVRTIK